MEGLGADLTFIEYKIRKLEFWKPIKPTQD